MKKSIIIISLLVFFSPLFAAVDTNNNAQNILQVFQAATGNWEAVIVPAALFVFWSLVAIDFVLTFGYMALKGTDFAEIFYELVRKVIIIGFFLFLFVTVDLMDKIPQSFSQLANSATGVNIQPDTILEQAFLMVNAIWDGLSI
jgi:type IV secretion system protein TrbL